MAGRPPGWTTREYKDELDRIRDGIEAIDPAKHAKGSRDFGRGFNYAMALVMDVLANKECGE
jgi:hypothetical protein